jgi:Hypoxia induced protein conserved region
MNMFLIFLIVLAAGATVFALVRGIIFMASGKDVSGQQSNKMMWYRVAFQGVTILLVVILMLAMGGRD